MKVKNLKKELECQIKELILKVLKEFDMSKYVIEINILDDECFIVISKGGKNITCIHYFEKCQLLIYVFDNIYSLIKPRNEFDIFGEVAYSWGSFLERLDDELIQIIKTLELSRDSILFTELKNILE